MQNENFKILRFAVIVCVVASAAVSLAAVSLRDIQALNQELDRKKKVLDVVGLGQRMQQSKSSEEVLDLYGKSIRGVVIDLEGKVVPGKKPLDIKDNETGSLLPVYARVEEGLMKALAIPVSGKGLWSTIYGYLSLENDLNTVRGLTFYQHGETPGLGGEIEKQWFRDNFVGKKIFDAKGELQSISVVRGKVKEVITGEAQKSHAVDGISGATITGAGVTQFLKANLLEYQPFLKRTKSKGFSEILK